MGGAPREGVFAGPMHGAVAGAVFALLLAAVCVSDLRTRRIPNWLVLLVLGLGLANAAALSGGSGLVRAAAGVGVGLILWLPLHVLRMMGAGDVKFFAAASAWVGPAIAVRATLLAAIFGGVLALVWVAGGLLRQRAMRGAAASANDAVIGLPKLDARSRKLPYGLAMAAGLATAVWWTAFPS